MNCQISCQLVRPLRSSVKELRADVGRAFTILQTDVEERTLLVTSVTKPPVNAPNPSWWHHAHGVDSLDMNAS
jgi:hypothetical protein